MGSPETQTPQEQFEAENFETQPAEQAAETDNVYNFETGEKVPIVHEQQQEFSSAGEIGAREEIGEPGEVHEPGVENQSVNAEQLNNAMEALREDIAKLDADIEARNQLIEMHKQYFDLTDLYRQHAALNRELIEHDRQINVLNRKLDAIAKDRTLFLGRIRHQDLYNKTETELNAVKEKQAAKRKLRSDETGNYVDLEEVKSRKNAIFEEMKQKLDSEMVPNSVYFLNLSKELTEQNRQDQKQILENNKEIAEFEKQLTLLTAFKK